jgi:hypothetical protein
VALQDPEMIPSALATALSWCLPGQPALKPASSFILVFWWQVIGLLCVCDQNRMGERKRSKQNKTLLVQINGRAGGCGTWQAGRPRPLCRACGSQCPSPASIPLPPFLCYQPPRKAPSPTGPSHHFICHLSIFSWRVMEPRSRK